MLIVAAGAIVWYTLLAVQPAVACLHGKPVQCNTNSAVVYL